MGIKKVQDKEALEFSKKKCLEIFNVFVDLCEKHSITYWLDCGGLLGSVRHKGMIPWDNDIDVSVPYNDYIKICKILYDFTLDKNNPYVLFFHKTGFEMCYDYFGDTSAMNDGIYPAHIDIECIKYIKNTPKDIKTDISWANIAGLYYNGALKYEDSVIPEHTHFLPTKEEDVLISANRFFKAYNQYMEDNSSLELEEKKENILLYYSKNDILVKRKRGHFKYTDVFPLGTTEFEGRTYAAPGNITAYLTHLYGENFIIPPPENERPKYMDAMFTAHIDKNKWHRFLIDFYKLGIRNYVLTSKNKKYARPIRRVYSSLLLAMKCIVRGDFSMLRGLIFYSYNKARNKAI